MKHGSLFSGIGGFDLASEWMGWENKFHCEINPFCQKVLKYYWPNAISYEDITKTDFSVHRGQIDLISGGFPCQPYSSAGKRLGKEDDRHLWPEMCRAIREIKPRWVVGENVYGLVNWNGGLVFNEVQTDLENEGYEVQPFLLPAVSVNAPHRRDRIFFVAYRTADSESGKSREQTEWQGGEGIKRGSADNDGIKREGYNTTNSNSIRLEQRQNRGQMEGGSTKMGRKRSKPTNATETNGSVQYASNTNSGGLEGTAEVGRNSEYVERKNSAFLQIPNWENFPIVSPICDGNDGISDRLDGITFPKWRIESIKSGGNAIVPQVVLKIFQAIEQYEACKQG